MGKKRLRDMTWDDYGISKNRYKELKAFCLQYGEKKGRIQYGAGGSPPAWEISGGRNAGSPVERQAFENESYTKDCKMVEEAAIRANPGIWRHILKSATQNLAYEYVEYDDEQGRITVGKTDFYAYRKLFYFYLHRLKIGDKLNEVTWYYDIVQKAAREKRRHSADPP